MYTLSPRPRTLLFLFVYTLLRSIDAFVLVVVAVVAVVLVLFFVLFVCH